MNAAEYQAYVAAVDTGSEGMDFLSSGPCAACEECNPEELPEDTFHQRWSGDSSFSWSPCDLCSRPLGGSRYPAHYVDSEGELVHIDVCTDCYYFGAYGQLDDMTMIEIEESDNE